MKPKHHTTSHTHELARWACLCMIAIFLAGCADHVTFQQATRIWPVGFMHGLWHGIILAFAFTAPLFDENVAIYEIYNNGSWYDFGFVIGCLGVLKTANNVTRIRIHWQNTTRQRAPRE